MFRGGEQPARVRHCEERSDEAIQGPRALRLGPGDPGEWLERATPVVGARRRKSYAFDAKERLDCDPSLCNVSLYALLLIYYITLL